MVLSHITRRHCKADQQASLSTLVSAISPALPSLTHLPHHESLPISRSSQVIPPLEPPLAGLRLQSTENDFSDANYGQPNLDDYKFRYPQNLYPPSGYIDLDDTLSNDGSQEIGNRTGQIGSRPETPDNTQLHEGYSWDPQIQSPGNSLPLSPSLNGSSNSATDKTEELELVLPQSMINVFGNLK